MRPTLLRSRASNSLRSTPPRSYSPCTSCAAPGVRLSNTGARRVSELRSGAIRERRQATAPTLTRVAYDVVRPDDFQWLTRPHEPGEPARHVAELSDRAGFAHVRGNIWRYEPGAKGRRHRHPTQEETFVVLAGTLSLYVGEPPQRMDVPAGGLARVAPKTPLPSANHGGGELLVYGYGYPPESEHAELLDSAL